MGDYIRINNYSRLGTLAISRVALQSAATRAVTSVSGAKLPNRKKWLFAVGGPVRVTLSKEGKADIAIDVSIASGVSVADVCLSIQKEVAGQIAMMCESFPVEIKLRVVKVG